MEDDLRWIDLGTMHSALYNCTACTMSLAEETLEGTKINGVFHKVAELRYIYSPSPRDFSGYAIFFHTPDQLPLHHRDDVFCESFAFNFSCVPDPRHDQEAVFTALKDELFRKCAVNYDGLTQRGTIARRGALLQFTASYAWTLQEMFVLIERLIPSIVSHYFFRLR